MLRAVGNSGLALEHAAWELKDDEEAGNVPKHVSVCAESHASLVQVVQLAVRCTGLALEFASTRTGGLKRKGDPPRSLFQQAEIASRDCHGVCEPRWLRNYAAWLRLGGDVFLF